MGAVKVGEDGGMCGRHPLRGLSGEEKLHKTGERQRVINGVTKH